MVRNLSFYLRRLFNNSIEGRFIFTAASECCQKPNENDVNKRMLYYRLFQKNKGHRSRLPDTESIYMSKIN